MQYSTCCGAETDMTEIDICPECLEHCDFEEEEEDEEEENEDSFNVDEQYEQSKINEHE